MTLAAFSSAAAVVAWLLVVVAFVLALVLVWRGRWVEALVAAVIGVLIAAALWGA